MLPTSLRNGTPSSPRPPHKAKVEQTDVPKKTESLFSLAFHIPYYSIQSTYIIIESFVFGGVRNERHTSIYHTQCACFSAPFLSARNRLPEAEKTTTKREISRDFFSSSFLLRAVVQHICMFSETYETCIFYMCYSQRIRIICYK